MADLLGLVSTLEGLLGFFQRERHASDAHSRLVAKDRQEALLALHAAILATRRYIEKLHGKEERELFAARDRDTEYELSELWAIAAIRAGKGLQSIDEGLFDKSRQWLYGIRWDNAYLKERGIDLESIEKRFEALVKQRN